MIYVYSITSISRWGLRTANILILRNSPVIISSKTANFTDYFRY